MSAGYEYVDQSILASLSVACGDAMKEKKEKEAANKGVKAPLII